MSSIPSTPPPPNTNTNTNTGNPPTSSPSSFSPSTHQQIHHSSPETPPNNNNPTPESSSSTQREKETTEAKTAFLATLHSVGANHESQIRDRARVLHSNSHALEKQETELQSVTDGLRKQNDSWAKVADQAREGLKEIGDVQNWAELIERDLLVVEEAVRLAEEKEERERERGMGEGNGHVREEERGDGDGDGIADGKDKGKGKGKGWFWW
ncbi:uncharacterized protein KD926_001908 [Aspergillus affinis]|uniref:uncharacterized protein n=1 Tax=Aspergillus affinis TaxID=1070780 RepID=UPI0022FE6BE7|nr:uncharacterized protein KD926_001908 [Aspergillus affinis]KAI9044085.1 hypothetical protein KD926_001908 [Aspergillus affinis]